MRDEAHLVPPSPCPGCGMVLDAANAADDTLPARPRPGDLSVCVHCCAMLAYNEDLTLRQATEKEVAIIMHDCHGAEVVEAIRFMLQSRGNGV